MKGFRPWHVVTMVVAICAAIVLAPAAVSAATGSQVNLVDKLNKGSIARVTAKGTLWTSPTDPITGVSAKVTARGALSTSAAAPAQPWNTVNGVTISSANTRSVIYQGVGASLLNLTSVTFAASSVSDLQLDVQVYVSDSSVGDCDALTGASFGAAERFHVAVPAGNTVNLSYPTPLVYSTYAGPTERYCVDVSGAGTGTWTGYISASGFLS